MYKLYSIYNKIENTNMSKLQQLFTETQENYELIPQFLDLLLVSDVYCLGTESAEQKLNFQILETPEGDQAIPFFLELEMIYRDFGSQVEHFTINTRKLFEKTQGATLVLNPTSALSKEFQPIEIKSILEMEQV